MTMHICDAGSKQGRQDPKHEDVIVVKDAPSYSNKCPLCEALDQVEKLEARITELEEELADERAASEGANP